jgi:REP element-mobilizing transposase RayT
MPRPPRLTAPSTVYHVILRCNAKEPLFTTPKDFESLLCVLAHYKRRHAFKLYGYCIMNTHAHLIIQTPDDEKASISKIMHNVASLYVRDYNTRHKRVGHFFGERFKSPIVEDDSYGIALLKYIAQNPVRAKMVKNARDWTWSSYRVYESGEPNLFIDFLPSFEGLARTRKRAAQMFAELVDGVIVKQDDGWTRMRVIGTKLFVKRLLGHPHDPLASDPPG